MELEKSVQDAWISRRNFILSGFIGSLGLLYGCGKEKIVYVEVPTGSSSSSEDNDSNQSSSQGNSSTPTQQYSYDISGRWKFSAKPLTNSDIRDMNCSVSATLELSLGDKISGGYAITGKVRDFYFSGMKGDTLYPFYPGLNGSAKGKVGTMRVPYPVDLELLSSSKLLGVVNEGNQLDNSVNTATFFIPGDYLRAFNLPETATGWEGPWKATRVSIE